MSKHSPLGASGAERWMQCPGSVALLKELTLPESDAPDYRREGTAAHEMCAYVLGHREVEPWELIGRGFDDGNQGQVEATQEMSNAAQVYLDAVAPSLALATEAGTAVLIEHPISAPVHPDFYGTADLAVIVPGTEFHKQENLEVTDLKYGEGIQIDVDDNPQVMYYAYGVMQHFPDVDKVLLRIVQPRGYHPDGPVREWQTSAQHIREWAENVLVPAMYRTELDNALDAGPWCRFCPAKLVCPLLNGLFKAAAIANPDEVVKLSDASVGRSYQYIQGVEFYVKALKDEALRRLNTGTYTGGVVKLVSKRADRVWKPEAKVLFTTKFPDDAMTEPKLKSPAEMEKVGPEAKKLVREYAYTPQTGVTVALLDDKRPEVKVARASEVFKAAAALASGEPAPAEDDLFLPLPAENADGLDIPTFLKREM